MADPTAGPPSDLEVSFRHEGFSCRSAAQVDAKTGLARAVLVILIFLIALASGLLDGLGVQGQLLAALAALTTGAALWAYAPMAAGRPLDRRRPVEIECGGTCLTVREAKQPERKTPLSTIQNVSAYGGVVSIECDGVRRIPMDGSLQHDHATWLADAIKACLPGPDEPPTQEEASTNQARRAAIRALMGAKDG